MNDDFRECGQEEDYIGENSDKQVEGTNMKG